MINLAGLSKLNINGYVAYYIPEHHAANKAGIVYEHIIIAEKCVLHRWLNKGEVVHHKDENKSNNNPQNLMVFKTKADHSAYHQGCEVKKENDVYIALNKENHYCPICGKYKDNKAKLCKDCFKNIVTKTPNEDMLDIMLQEHNYNKSEVARIFGVSHTTINRWCKKYKL